MFILCSPHNPVGRVWTKDELSRLAEICQRHHVLVVDDEIHHDFIRPGHQHTVFSTLSDAVANNTITCTSPSKTFNLAGLQLSNIFIPNESLRRKFKQELLATGYGEPNIFGMTAAKAAYGQGLPWLTELKSYLEENLQRTKNYLAANLPKARLIEPEGTYLIWIDFSAYNLSDEVLDDLIINKGRVWLDSGHIFGAGGYSAFFLLPWLKNLLPIITNHHRKTAFIPTLLYYRGIFCPPQSTAGGGLRQGKLRRPCGPPLPAASPCGNA